MSTNIALESNGEFGVFSGTGWRRVQGQQHVVLRDIPSWQGTGVYLEFDRSTMGNVSVHALMQQLPGYAEVPDLTFG